MKGKNSKVILLVAIFLLFVVVIAAIKYNIINITNLKGSATVYYQGQNVSNFLIQQINPNNVTGLMYMWYPVRSTYGTPTVLHIGDTVGYNCDGSLKKLVAISSSSATFANVSTQNKYGCPV